MFKPLLKATGVAIAFAMAASLGACAHTGQTLRLSNCQSHWAADGYQHYTIQMSNDGSRAISSAELFLSSRTPGVSQSSADAMNKPSFYRLVRFSLPLQWSGSLPPGSGIVLAVRSTNHRAQSFITTFDERQSSCYVGAVTYSNGTTWSHGVNFGVTGLRKPYFVSEHTK